jgi:glycosyltransferase involved in cell wall biosynthesis
LIPRISIVTPSYNQRAFIASALESVRSQNYLSLEHIVIDGASTDDTVEYLQSLSGRAEWQHLRWISEPDRGQSEALNKGFKMASGNIIGWLNSDDVYRPGCFAAVDTAFAGDGGIDVLYGDTTWIDENSRMMQVRREIDFNRFVMLFHRVLCVPTAATFFSRRVFDEGNLIDVQYRYAMDLEFFLRLQSLGYRFRHLPKLLADFRWHGASKSSTSARKQYVERDKIVPLYSPLLAKLHPPLLNRGLLELLRCAAACRYWGEKFARGYYFERLLSRR